MPNYEKQIQKIKNKSFPYLKNHKIIIKKKSSYGIRVIYLYFFSLYVIGKGAEKGLTKGGLAHELSHIEVFKKWGFWKTACLSFLQYFSKKIRMKIERSADLLAIKRGYGKELYKTRKKSYSKVPKRVKKLLNNYYLSLEEIEKYTRKQKIR
jgi:hypothetical protein